MIDYTTIARSKTRFVNGEQYFMNDKSSPNLDTNVIFLCFAVIKILKKKHQPFIKSSQTIFSVI